MYIVYKLNTVQSVLSFVSMLYKVVWFQLLKADQSKVIIMCEVYQSRGKMLEKKLCYELVRFCKICQKSKQFNLHQI
jgi:hypothetical protein